MITRQPMGIIDEELKKLRMAGQMPVALATGSAGYAIGSTPVYGCCRLVVRTL
jgi:hypothetical protein